MSPVPFFRSALALSLFALGAHAAQAAPDGATMTVNAGAAYVSDYAGSDQQRLRPVIALDYQNASGFFAGTGRGIGYVTLLDGLRLSGALAYAPGRGDSERTFGAGSDALRGMGTISGSAVASLGAGYDFGSLQVGINAHLALTNRDRGNTMELSASVPLLRTESDKVSLGMKAKYGDGKNNQTFYGVTAAQSARSGYRAYQAGSGFESTQLGVNWHHTIDKHWSINTLAGVNHLVGDAANSPLTKRTTAPVLAVTAGYAF